MNKYYPSTVQEAENLLTEGVVKDPRTIVIVKSRDDHPVSVLAVEGNVLGFHGLDDCRTLCHLLNEAYTEGLDDGTDKGFQDGFDAGREEIE
jgi:hypothetical protein